MRSIAILAALLLACVVRAQDLVVYDDALRNDFLPGYSYGGGTDLDNTTPTRNGSTRSIAFTGDNFNAVAFANQARIFDTAQYGGLRFYVHGGASGNQQLRLQIYSDLGDTLVHNVELDSYIAGGAIAANQWRQVEVRFADPPLAFSGSFKRFDLQSDVSGAQPTLYIDDVSLLAAAPVAPVFADGFEELGELLFAPQYAQFPNPPIDLRIFRRTPGGFVPLRALDLGPDLLLNSLAFAPDGKLWALDNSGRRLLRYSRTALLSAANPAAEVVIGPIGNPGEELFDIAFFGDFVYLTLSNFGAVNRVLKYPLASFNASGNPAPTVLTNADLSTPAGLAFDPQGRLWVSNYGNDSLVRISTADGTVDRRYTFVGLGGRGSLAAPEGLAFDAQGTLWVGNNKEATISAYSAEQIAGFVFDAVVPIHQIDVAPGYGGADTLGGVAFDGAGRLWANYQQDPLTLREYALTPAPDLGSYQSALGQVLSGATTRPGFGGLAFWPPPATLHRGTQGAGAAQFRGTTLVGMESSYQFFDPLAGPIQGTHYPYFDERLIDYFAGKGMTALRFLVCWEALQSELMGPIPAAPAGNYRVYFDNYQRIVDYATKVKGMTVLVTPWQAGPGGGIGGVRWRGGLVGTPAVPIAAWQDFWRKLAASFADNPRVEFVLVTEPHDMPTMDWWTIAQAGIDAIRDAGATQRIHVPGNGYTAASSWTSTFYDTGPAPKRSNAYGWLNANGPGQPISDPLNKLVAEVHTYLDGNQSGGSSTITSITAAREQLAVTVNEARTRGYEVYLGEIGIVATEPLAAAAWADFIDYFEANSDVLVGFTWWAGSTPAWWPVVGAPYFSISPTNPATYTGDTVNMTMIENDF